MLWQKKNENKKKQSCQISQNLRLPPSNLVVEQTDEPTYLIKVQKVWAFFVKIEHVETSLNKSTIVKDDKSFPIHPPPDQLYNGLKSILKEHPIFNTTIKIRLQLQKSFHPILNWFDTKKFDVPLKFRIKIRNIIPFRA